MGNLMKTAQFIGREAEMARLKGLLSARSANLMVVRGRRIGKSRLLADSAKR
jgi:AAA+ ATPase superfamily predicted ATPase